MSDLIPTTFVFGYLSCFLAFYFKYKGKELDKINFDKELKIILAVTFIALILSISLHYFS